MPALVKENPVPIIVRVITSAAAAFTRAEAARVVVSEVAEMVPEVRVPGIGVLLLLSWTLAAPVAEVLVPTTE